MPSTPTTKPQVQAYQFVLRRMQSALVRKDAVMLHDPMRTHSRATIVGVVLAALGLLGFLIVGLFTKSGAKPSEGIVIGKESGTVYVASGTPMELTPTFNLASARLLLMAQQQSAGGAQQGGGFQPAEVSVVSDEALKDMPKNRMHGLLNVPDLLPTQEQLISNDWAICDDLQVDESLPEQSQLENASATSTIFAGLPSRDLGTELRQDQAILVAGDDGKYYLVYRLPPSQSQPKGNTVRAEVDPDDAEVQEALQLDKTMARKITPGLFNAIPAEGALEPVSVDGAGSATSGYTIGGSLPVGSVFQVERAGLPTQFYVALRPGIQQVSQIVADLIRAGGDLTGDIPTVPFNEVANAPVAPPAEQLDVGHYPQQRPTVLDSRRNHSTCLGWTVRGEAQNREAVTAVYVKADRPGPKNARDLIKLGQAGPDGVGVDNFYMTPGYAAAVHAVPSAAEGDNLDRGLIQIISDRGMRYAVPSKQILEGLLGHGELRQAPQAIIKLLPVGDTLDPQAAQRTFDAVPLPEDAGSFEPAQGSATGGN